jgi:hypothetical protein
MDVGGVNILAVIVSAIAAYVVGMLWYSPLLFVNVWMDLLGKKKDGTKPKASMFVLGFLGILITAFFIGFFMEQSPVQGIPGGIAIAGILWLGFAATGSLDTVIYEGRPWALWALNNTYRLLTFIIMGVIYGAWM